MQFVKGPLKKIKKKKFNSLQIKRLSKKLRNLKFILNKIKYRFFFNNYFNKLPAKLKVSHNKIFYLNMFSLKNFLLRNQRDLRNTVKLAQDIIFFKRILKLKKKKFLKKKKKNAKVCIKTSFLCYIL